MQDVEIIEKENIDDKINQQLQFYRDSKFDERGFFSLGINMRKLWPHDVNYVHTKLPALTLSEWGLKNNEIVFQLASSNWIDPYSFYIEFNIENNNNFPVQLDNSIHSLFSSISISVNGNEVENLTDYPLLSKIYFDMSLSNKQRQERHKTEGFSYYDKDAGVYKPEPLIDPVQKNMNNNQLGNQRIKHNPGELSAISQYVEHSTMDTKNKRPNAMIPGTQFKMPLMSKFFGQRIEPKNWKLM